MLVLIAWTIFNLAKANTDKTWARGILKFMSQVLAIWSAKWAPTVMAVIATGVMIMAIKERMILFLLEIQKIPTEHIYGIFSLDFQLFFSYICSIRILNSLKDIHPNVQVVVMNLNSLSKCVVYLFKHLNMISVTFSKVSFISLILVVLGENQ